MLMSLISSKVAFAGDFLFDVASGITDKPNTGDSNILIIYGAIIGIALIALIFINCTGKSKGDKLKLDENLDVKEDSGENKLDDVK